MLSPQRSYLDIDQFIEEGYILVRREDLGKDLSQAVVAKYVRDISSYRSGMKDFFKQPLAVKQLLE